jgi:arginase
VALIAWPFDQGLPDLGMGAGAAFLASDDGINDALEAPTVQRVTAAAPGTPEIARTFDVLRQLARDVRGAVDAGRFPLVLAGGCISAAATFAGAGAPDAGVVWLDAHADLDTPDDNASGFLDVMALSILTGRCWRTQRATIPGFAAVPEERVALLGVRDLAPYQRAALEASRVRASPGAFDADGAATVLYGLPPATYLHIDLDVLDTSVGKANHYAAPGGPGLEAVLAVVDAVFDRGPVVAATLSAYDPTADRDGAILHAARAIARRIGERVSAARSTT